MQVGDPNAQIQYCSHGITCRSRRCCDALLNRTGPSYYFLSYGHYCPRHLSVLSPINWSILLISENFLQRGIRARARFRRMAWSRPRQYSTGGRSILVASPSEAAKYLRTPVYPGGQRHPAAPPAIGNAKRSLHGFIATNWRQLLQTNRRIAQSVLRNERSSTPRVTRPWRSEPGPHPRSRQTKGMERIDECIKSLVARMVACQPVR
jgi:hypothetical protein